MLSELLKDRTGAHHRRLEKIIIGRLKGIKTVADYAAIIKCFCGYYLPLEQQLANYEVVDILPDIGSRRKLASLYIDLKHLGISGLDARAVVKPVNSLSEAIGCIYVMEGSTLGGSIIVQMLRKAIPEAEDSFSFFAGYGDANMSMWDTFRMQLFRHGGDLDTEAVVQGAIDTFDGLAEWFLQNEN